MLLVLNGFLFFQTIAHDKGKPVVRQGRKAMSLDSVEIVRPPKAIEEKDVILLDKDGGRSEFLTRLSQFVFVYSLHPLFLHLQQPSKLLWQAAN
jgi:hypothetical protein